MTTELAEVAVLRALIDRLKLFADVPVAQMQLPNVGDAAGGPFTSPAASAGNIWLRARHLPNTSAAVSVSASGSAEHYGFLQVDVMCDPGAGEYTPGRVAAALIAHFGYCSNYFDSGFRVCVYKLPYRGSLRQDGPWMMMPVSVPYQCFAANPAKVG